MCSSGGAVIVGGVDGAMFAQQDADKGKIVE
jgi:hypothetical protein